MSKIVYFIAKENGNSQFYNASGVEIDGVAFTSLKDLHYRWNQYIDFINKKDFKFGMEITKNKFSETDSSECVFEFSYKRMEIGDMENTINCGMYVLKRELFDNLEEYKESPSNQESDD